MYLLIALCRIWFCCCHGNPRRWDSIPRPAWLTSSIPSFFAIFTIYSWLTLPSSQAMFLCNKLDCIQKFLQLKSYFFLTEHLLQYPTATFKRKHDENYGFSSWKLENSIKFQLKLRLRRHQLELRVVLHNLRLIAVLYFSVVWVDGDKNADDKVGKLASHNLRHSLNSNFTV